MSEGGVGACSRLDSRNDDDDDAGAARGRRRPTPAPPVPFLFDALTLRDIRYVVALARARSLAGAARELGVTPQAVSQRLVRLERALAAPLFIRRIYALTPDGHRLVRAVGGLPARALAVSAAILGADGSYTGGRSPRRRPARPGPPEPAAPMRSAAPAHPACVHLPTIGLWPPPRGRWSSDIAPIRRTWRRRAWMEAVTEARRRLAFAKRQAATIRAGRRWLGPDWFDRATGPPS